MKLIVNHIGYESQETKIAICQAVEGEHISSYEILREDGTSILKGETLKSEIVEEWDQFQYYIIDFSTIRSLGSYYIQVVVNETTVRSEMFEISNQIRSMRLMNAIRCYFKSQRVCGEWQKADKHLTFWGKKSGNVDLHGGWFDATGDYGVHMSHLTYTGVFTPNQTPMVAYALFEALQILEQQKTEDCAMLKRHLKEEAFWGADHLMRFHAPSGSFYRSIERGGTFLEPPVRFVEFDSFVSGENRRNDIDSIDEEITDANYEVGFRNGGGIAIAALACAARVPYTGSDYPSEEYIQTACESFDHLMKHNEEHVSDGAWNLLDEYGALIAAVELYNSTEKEEYEQIAGKLARSIQKRTRTFEDGVWFESVPGQLYFHAVEEGFPILALLKYAQIAKDMEQKKECMQCATLALDHVINISTGNNPFCYPKYKVERNNKLETRFFFPHDTCTAPWWQGENARLASLATAARYMATLSTDDEKKQRYLTFACRQLDWIMGVNPFDACMIEGYGRNNIQYFYQNHYDFMNCPGGICNGITSGLNDTGIAFITQPGGEVDDNWRWAEQWLPHAAWFLYALVLNFLQ